MIRIAIFLSLVASLVLEAASLHGKVVAVADGDTLTLLDKRHRQHKVRLLGIDAPEKKQPFGNVAKQILADQVFGKDIKVDYKKKDRYGRVLGKILINDDDVCLSQIRAGLAWHYKQYEKSQTAEDRRAYADAEAEAKIKKQGIWSESNPTPPWIFRKSGKSRRGIATKK